MEEVWEDPHIFCPERCVNNNNDNNNNNDYNNNCGNIYPLLIWAFLFIDFIWRGNRQSFVTYQDLALFILPVYVLDVVPFLYL